MEIRQPMSTKSLINLKSFLMYYGSKVPIGYKRNATAGELPRAKQIDWV